MKLFFLEFIYSQQRVVDSFKCWRELWIDWVLFHLLHFVKWWAWWLEFRSHITDLVSLWCSLERVNGWCGTFGGLGMTTETRFDRCRWTCCLLFDCLASIPTKLDLPLLQCDFHFWIVYTIYLYRHRGNAFMNLNSIWNKTIYGLYISSLVTHIMARIWLMDLLYTESWCICSN